MNLFDMTPAKVLVLRYALEEQLTRVGSITGVQLEQLRQGLVAAPADGAHADPQASLRLAYQDTLVLCRDLSEQEERATRLRYGTSGGVERYEALVKLEDVERQAWGDGPAVLGTKRGEEYVGPGPEGSARVRGSCQRWLSFSDIGQRMGLSSRQAESRVKSACGKVRFAQQERQHRDSLDAA